jgi:hypothetical protein
MNELEFPQSIADLTDGIISVIDYGKQSAEKYITASNIINCVGAAAVISSLAHAKEGNYFRAAGYAGLGIFHLQQRGPSSR